MPRRDFTKVPFAATGDATSIPTAVQQDGSVSMAAGFGFDYQRDNGAGGGTPDPLAKSIPRDATNGILNEITSSIGEIQLNGLAIWAASAAPYPINALVRFSGSNWRSTTDNNTSKPGQTGASWIDPNSQPYANTEAPGIVQLSTNQEAIGGTENSKAATSLRVAEYVASKNFQENLGYTPVQQGGGIGQNPNKVYLGWGDANRLKVTVGSTDLGNVVFDGSTATESVVGVAKIATSALALAGTDNATIMTPLKVKQSLDQKLPFVPVESSPGEIVITSANAAPPGTLKANGSTVSRTAYAALFAKIGTTYGAGDGSTTFNIPDARAEFIRGLDDGRGIDAGRVLGSYQADSVRSVGIFGESGNPFTQGGTAGNGYLRTGLGNVVIPAGTETRPRNIAFLLCIRY